MDDKQFCIEFMKIKQKFAGDLPYFNEEDLKDIQQTDVDLSEILFAAERILYYDSIPTNWSVFNSATCPFCLIQEAKSLACDTCPYGERHGLYDEEDDNGNPTSNDYHNLCDSLRDQLIKGDRDFIKRRGQFIEDLQELIDRREDPDRHGLV